MRYCLVLAWCFVVTSNAVQSGGRTAQPKIPSAITGVWEQVGLELENEKLEETRNKSFNFRRIVMINQGNESYWAGSITAGAVAAAGTIQLPDPERPAAVDIVVSDGRRTRSLFERTPTNLIFCWHADGLEQPRPERIKSSDGFSIARFQKLVEPPQLMPSAPKDTKWLSGVWNTVGFCVDGRPLEAEELKQEFDEVRNVYHFDSDVCRIFGGDSDTFALTIRQQRYRFRPDIGKDAIDFVEGKKVISARFVQVGDSLRIAWSDSGERPKSVDPVVGNKVAGLSRLVPGKKAKP